MIDWEWKKQEVAPTDILDAARTITPTNTVITFDAIPEWTAPHVYLDWAKTALARASDEGWDSASMLAKRAVCRRMDGILVHNHFADFLGKTYAKKAKYLGLLEIPGLNLLREFVLDPRNTFEHSYALAGPDHARRAVELAELFVCATEADANKMATGALGWNVSFKSDKCCKPGYEREEYDFWITHNNKPMLLIDGFSGDVFVLHPRDHTVFLCQRKLFEDEQVLSLNNLLRQRADPNNYSVMPFDAKLMSIVRTHLRL